MQFRPIPARPDWQQTADAHGFDFHSPDGTVYWDESHCYTFTLDEIESGLEAPTAELEAMCLDIVATAVRDEAVLERLRIPRDVHDCVAASWRPTASVSPGRWWSTGSIGRSPCQSHQCPRSSGSRRRARWRSPGSMWSAHMVGGSIRC